MASSLTSGVAGAASKAAGLGPSMMYHGGYCIVNRQAMHPAEHVSLLASGGIFANQAALEGLCTSPTPIHLQHRYLLFSQSGTAS